jgi:transcriptional regulator with XRE-family HTH domain
MPPAGSALGVTIRSARERLHMTQQDLADAVGVSARTIGNWEQGHRLPKNRMGALEEVLGVNLTGTSVAAPPEPDLIPGDDWEADVLADAGLPDHLKRQLILDSRAVRARYPARPEGPGS